MLGIDVSSLAKRLLPAAAVGYVVATKLFLSHPAWLLSNVVKEGIPDRLIYFGVAPGDDLLCTAVLRELSQRNRGRSWMMTNYPELFAGNADVDRLVPVQARFRHYAFLKRGVYTPLEYAEIDWDRDRSEPPKRHIIAELCQRVGIVGQINLRPYYYPTTGELARFSSIKNMIAIQSTGIGGMTKMANKQWFPERFQAVVNSLRGDFQFIQVGSADDPPLAGVAQNLQGKTTIRDVGAILANCLMYVGNVGFLMHLARAVGTRSVIVYGGREAPWQSGYKCNVNLYSPEPCAPCWLWNTCDYQRVCMDRITSDQVIDSILRLAPQRSAPIEEEVDCL